VQLLAAREEKRREEKRREFLCFPPDSQ